MSKKKIKKRIRCSPCENDILAAEYIKVCRRSGKRKECRVILNKYMEDKITARNLFKEVRKLAGGDKRLLKALDKVDEIIEEMHGEGD